MQNRGKIHSAIKRLRDNLKKTLNRISPLIYPEALVCINCQSEIINDDERFYSLCRECMEKLPFRTGRTCNICGSYIHEADDFVCKDCLRLPRPYKKIYTAFDYEGIIKNMIVNYKIYGNTYLYIYIARFLVDYFKASDIKADYVCYVPAAERTIKRRGFDHLKKVLEEFCKKTEMEPVYPLIRIKESFRTKRHTKEERAKNIENAFDLNKNEKSIKGKRILLIDDVVTTAVTASECSKALIDKCGASEVVILALSKR